MSGANASAGTVLAARTAPVALAAAPLAALAFVAMLVLAAVAVRHGLIGDDALRLWAAPAPPPTAKCRSDALWRPIRRCHL